ncbi:site-2 protease family protein [Paenibacillus sp. RS8]|uniref:site-2 protease family protein n=1 Tax=Paenibacillus sp. RS8 TaxID=3242681 RepID=UPI0035BF01E4
MLFFYILVVPLSVFLHEMGHALAALVLTKRTVLIYMGANKRRQKATLILGRLQFYFTWGFMGSVATKEDEKQLSKYQNIGISIGGPLVSLFLVIVMIVLYFSIQMRPFFDNIVFAAGVFNLINLCVTLIPTIYSTGPYAGLPSDGYQILTAMGKGKIH